MNYLKISPIESENNVSATNVSGGSIEDGILLYGKDCFTLKSRSKNFQDSFNLSEANEIGERIGVNNMLTVAEFLQKEHYLRIGAGLPELGKLL